MFSYAVNHPKLKADLEARNHQKLSPLTLASKLGRFQLFNEIMQLQSRVRSLRSHHHLFASKTIT